MGNSILQIKKYNYYTYSKNIYFVVYLIKRIQMPKPIPRKKHKEVCNNKKIGLGCTKKTGSYRYGDQHKYKKIKLPSGTIKQIEVKRVRRTASKCKEFGEIVQCMASLVKTPNIRCRNCGGAGAVQFNNVIYYVCKRHLPKERGRMIPAIHKRVIEANKPNPNKVKSAKIPGFDTKNIPIKKIFPGVGYSKTKGLQGVWKRVKKQLMYTPLKLHGKDFRPTRGVIEREIEPGEIVPDQFDLPEPLSELDYGESQPISHIQSDPGLLGGVPLSDWFNNTSIRKIHL